jgi:hypothetical protein
MEQMRHEELKIEAFTQEQMENATAVASIKALFEPGEEHDGPGNAYLERLKDEHVHSYYRRQYLASHPEALAMYNPGRVALKPKEGEQDNDGPANLGNNILCDYGDFETATAGTLAVQGYNGYEGAYSSAGACSSIPFTNVAYTNVGFGNTDNFMVTHNVADPFVPALRQTNNNSAHAIRINAPSPCPPAARVNMLQKSFLAPASGKLRINFSYAMVAENPPYDHLGANTFFLARVLDQAGNEAGARICTPTTLANPQFQSTSTKACGLKDALIVWKDWTCEYIEFDAEANKTYTIEFFVADCLGAQHYAYAYVDDICADAVCCYTSPPTPKNLKCAMVSNGSKLTWDPVPGAAYYKLFVTTFDPSCCRFVNPPYGMTVITNTPNPTFTVPTSVFSCFSWRVAVVMTDSCQSAMSDPKCSCSPPPPAPDSLKCTTLPDGSKLSWNPVPGAAYYSVYVTTFDPLCCPVANPPYGYSTIWNTSNLNITVPSTFAYCFSWKVETVMPDSSRSNFSATKCSCTPPPPPPTGLDCDSLPDGSSLLSWNPVAGAVHYKVIITTYDPACCPVSNPPYGYSVEWYTNTPNITVASSFASCFSWKVVTVMADSAYSPFSITKCSCPRQRTLRKGSNKNMALTGATTAEGPIGVTATPNPASQFVTFTLYGLGTDEATDGLTLYLFDLNGKEMMRKAISKAEKLELNVAAYSSGTYIYELRDRKKSRYKNKLVIEKH